MTRTDMPKALPAKVVKPQSEEGQLSLDFVSVAVIKPVRQSEKVTKQANKEIITNIKESFKLLELTKSFTLLERRLYLLVLREIKNIQQKETQKLEPWAELRFQFHFSELINGHTNSRIKTLVEKIQTRTISWEDNNEVHKSIVIFPEAEYELRKGIIRLTMYHKVIPLFLDLSKGFSMYQFELAMSLTSEYAQAILPYIARWVGQGVWLVTLSRFREIVDCVNKYKNFAHLRQTVIDVALTQINMFSEFEVKLKVKTKGRVVTSLEFQIKLKAGKKSALKLHQPTTSDLFGADSTTNKESIAVQLERLKEMSNEEAQLHVANLFKIYDGLSFEQRSQIVTDPEKLLTFFRADLYVQSGNVGNPMAYIIESVFKLPRSIK